uniref:SAM domain-containing protein n=1 Tax=Panagrolaimus sp. ES5 TaxID=591445 RepID=A0AC34GTG8_9BILA
MSGNNVQKSKSPRPIAIAPAPEKPPPLSIAASTASGSGNGGGGGGNELNGKRKLAPRPSDETIKPLIKIQPNNIKKDSSPTTTTNNNNGKIAPAPAAPQSSQQPAPTTSAAATAAVGQMMSGSYILRPVSNPNNQRMFPSYFSASAHPHLQQRLQATIDPNGNIITIPIAPRPSSISSTPSTSEAQTTASLSATAASSTSTPTTTKPPKICPRPIEKKLAASNSAATTSATPAAAMNLTPQNIIPTPQLNTGGALIGFAPNGTPIGYLQHPSAALGAHQLRFIQPQALTRMQMSHLNPMSIFPHPPQILHPAAFLSAGGGNATFISQSIQNNNSQIPQQFLSISGFNPNQIPTSFMNSINSHVSHQQQQQFHHHQQQQLHQHQQQQQQQQQQQNLQPKLIPITAIPSTSMTTTISSMATSSLNPPSLIPHPFSHPPSNSAAGLIPIAPAPEISSLEGSKIKHLEASDDDENEPPPLLDRDETVPASVHEAFVQEAAGVRMQYPLLGTEGNEPLRHVIDGFIIEESAVPFKIDDVIKEPLEVLRQFAKHRKVKKEIEVAEQELLKDSKKDIKKVAKKLQKSQKAENVSSTQNITGPKKRGRKTLRTPSPSKSNRKRRSSSSTQQNQQNQQKEQQQESRPSPAKSIRSPPPERPGSSKGPRKSREIEQLISMDFGPKNPIFKTKSVDEYTKGIQRRQQTSLRPVILQDYKERSPEISREGDEQQCLNCKFTFAQLKIRCEKYPQYCTKDCRKEFRKNAKKARQELADAKSMEPSSSFSSNINEMAAALIGKSPENGSNNNINNGNRKRLSNESESSTVSHHIPIKSSPLKLRIRSSSDLESPASSSQILSPAPSTSTAYLPMMPGPSSTPSIINMNTSNGSIPAITSPPPFSLTAGPPPNPNQNTPDFARLTEQAGLNPTDVNSWSAEDVAKWVNAITNSQTNGEIFLTEEIDGSSIFMLNQTQITQELGVKFGPTLKIVRAIEWLRNL